MLASDIVSPAFDETEALSSDTLFRRAMEKDGVSFSDDNKVTLLMSGQEKFDDLFAAVKKAKSSIHLEYFNFRNDSIAFLLFDLLAEKAKEGVEIRALYDAFGNSSNNRPLKSHHVKALRARGIEIYEFDPIRFPWVNHIFGRDHRKIVVIDGKIAYTGGMNVADYYIKGTPVVGAWRDMHCRIEGSEVATLQRIFVHAWKKVTGQDITGIKYYPGGVQGVQETSRLSSKASRLSSLDSRLSSLDSLLSTLDSRLSTKTLVGVSNREPHTSPAAVRQLYLNAINCAQDTIRLINPYFTLIPKVRKAILNAVKRGVVVQIMVAAPSDIPLTPDCAFYNVHKLMKKGCEVWIYKPGFHHTKVFMIDGKYCTVGSTNLDSRSLRCDYEENLAIIDKNVTQQLTDMFERDKKDSFRLTPESWKQWRTPWQRFRGWFAHLLAPLL